MMLPVAARIRPWQVVLVLALIYLGAVFLLNGSDPKVFVTLGTCFSSCQGHTETCPAGTTIGYDGQFAYYIARDPASATPCLDVPAYRYQRILLPILGRLLAFGNESLIPLALVAANLAALVGGTALLETLLAERRVSRWYALIYGLFVGVFMSVRLSTTEPLAYGLVILGLWFAARGRPGLQAAAFALAALAKELALVFAAAWVLDELLRRRWGAALRLALVSALPFALWQIVLKLSLGSFGVGSGGAGGTPFEIIPFNGFWRLAYDPASSFNIFLLMAVFVVPAVLLPSLWALLMTLRDAQRGQLHPYGLLLLANAALMAVVPFSTYREPLGLMRFMPGLVLCHLLYCAVRHPRSRALRYSVAWLALSVYLTAG
jgi:hypothetical protein